MVKNMITLNKNTFVGFSAAKLLLVLMFCLAGCNNIGAVGPISKKYYYTKTKDGCTLAMRRYQPEQLSQGKAPVILCHGLGYNLTYWDLDESVSLANYLAGEGYDVWSLSLRGAAPSSQPLNSGLRKLGRFNLDPEMFNKFRQHLQDLQMIDWSVDDHINYDIPAAIELVCGETGHSQIHWIGHSMGGMIMFAYLQQNQDTSKVKSFVAASTPMVVFRPLSDPFALLVENEGTISIGSKIVGTSAPAGLGSIFGDMGTPMDKLFFNGQNIDKATLQKLFYISQEEISPSQFKQLINMVRTEQFKSLDEKINYIANLSKVTTPTYFLVGTVDNMATVAAVKFVYNKVGSAQKKYALFGRVNNHKNDYGHDDIIIGKHAAKEVYPTIIDWLKQFPIQEDESKLLLQSDHRDTIAK